MGKNSDRVGSPRWENERTFHVNMSSCVCGPAEQFAGGDELIGEEELDLHLAVRRLVEGVDMRLDDVFGQRRTGVGLQAPLDRRLAENGGRGQRRSTGGGNGSKAGLLEEIGISLSKSSPAPPPTPRIP